MKTLRIGIGNSVDTSRGCKVVSRLIFGIGASAPIFRVCGLKYELKFGFGVSVDTSRVCSIGSRVIFGIGVSVPILGCGLLCNMKIGVSVVICRVWTM